MLGIFLFVFCGESIAEFSNFAPGLNGYWQKTPPAAAVAQDIKTAKGYLDCLANSVVGTTRIIGIYGQVSGQDCQGGALLTVSGYRIFVANVSFAAVFEYHINSLINAYNSLARKASSLATSARRSSSPAASPTASTSTLSPTASGGQPAITLQAPNPAISAARIHPAMMSQTPDPTLVPAIVLPPSTITPSTGTLSPTASGGQPATVGVVAPQQLLNPIGSGSATLQPSPDPTLVPAIVLPPSTSTLPSTTSGGQPTTVGGAPQQLLNPIGSGSATLQPSPDPTLVPAIVLSPSTSNPQSAAPTVPVSSVPVTGQLAVPGQQQPQTALQQLTLAASAVVAIFSPAKTAQEERVAQNHKKVKDALAAVQPKLKDKTVKAFKELFDKYVETMSPQNAWTKVTNEYYSKLLDKQNKHYPEILMPEFKS